MRFEINVKSTPRERYNGTVHDEVRPVFAVTDTPIAYEEGGSGEGGADNIYGFDADTTEVAEVLAETVRITTRREVTLVDVAALYAQVEAQEAADHEAALARVAALGVTGVPDTTLTYSLNEIARLIERDASIAAGDGKYLADLPEIRL